MVEATLRQRPLPLLRPVDRPAGSHHGSCGAYCPGGKTTKGNVVPCCKACNNQKKNLLPMEWDAYLQKMRDGIDI